MANQREVYSIYVLAYAQREARPYGEFDKTLASSLGCIHSRSEKMLMPTELAARLREMGAEPDAEQDDECDVGPSARDERIMAEAHARLSKLILAGGKVETGGRSLYESASDEIVRLRAALSDETAAAGSLAARVVDISAELQQAKEALTQARALADGLRDADGVLRREVSAARDELGAKPGETLREAARRIADALMRELAGGSAAEMRERCRAKAPAPARGTPGKATGAEAAEAGKDSVAEEPSGAQVARVHDVWRKDGHEFQIVGIVGDEADMVRTGTLRAVEKVRQIHRGNGWVLVRRDGAAQVGRGGAEFRAVVDGNGVRMEAIAPDGAKASWHIEPGAPAALPKPKRVEVGQRWVHADWITREEVVHVEADCVTFEDGTVTASAREMLTSDEWTFLGTTPQGPSPKREDEPVFVPDQVDIYGDPTPRGAYVVGPVTRGSAEPTDGPTARDAVAGMLLRCGRPRLASGLADGALSAAQTIAFLRPITPSLASDPERVACIAALEALDRGDLCGARDHVGLAAVIMRVSRERDDLKRSWAGSARMVADLERQSEEWKEATGQMTPFDAKVRTIALNGLLERSNKARDEYGDEADRVTRERDEARAEAATLRAEVERLKPAAERAQGWSAAELSELRREHQTDRGDEPKDRATRWFNRRRLADAALVGRNDISALARGYLNGVRDTWGSAELDLMRSEPVREWQPGTETVFDVNRKTRLTFPRGAESRDVLATVADLLGFKPADLVTRAEAERMVAEEARRQGAVRLEAYEKTEATARGLVTKWDARRDELFVKMTEAEKREDEGREERFYGRRAELGECARELRAAFGLSPDDGPGGGEASEGEAPGESVPEASQATPSVPEPITAPDREALGRAVHETWFKALGETGRVAPPWESRNEAARERDRRVGVRLFAMGARHGRAEAEALYSRAVAEKIDMRRELEVARRERDTAKLEAEDWASRWEQQDARLHVLEEHNADTSPAATTGGHPWRGLEYEVRRELTFDQFSAKARTDGYYFSALFHGHHAETRAREYAAWVSDPVEAPRVEEARSGMRIETRDDGEEYLVGVPERMNGCFTKGIDPKEFLCTYHFNGEHVATFASDDAECICERWPIAPSQDEPQATDRAPTPEPVRPLLSIGTVYFASREGTPEERADIVASLTRHLQATLDGQGIERGDIDLLANVDGSVRVEMPRAADPRAVLATVAELLGLTETAAPSVDSPTASPDREALGRAVHEVWRTERRSTIKWEDCTDEDHEADRRVGERLFAMGVQAGAKTLAAWQQVASKATRERDELRARAHERAVRPAPGTVAAALPTTLDDGPQPLAAREAFEGWAEARWPRYRDGEVDEHYVQLARGAFVAGYLASKERHAERVYAAAQSLADSLTPGPVAAPDIEPVRAALRREADAFEAIALTHVGRLEGDAVRDAQYLRRAAESIESEREAHLVLAVLGFDAGARARAIGTSPAAAQDGSSVAQATPPEAQDERWRPGAVWEQGGDEMATTFTLRRIAPAAVFPSTMGGEYARLVSDMTPENGWRYVGPAKAG